MSSGTASSGVQSVHKPYPLPGLIAFSTVGVPLAGMLLALGLWVPRYYITLLHKGGMKAVAATALVGLAFAIVRLCDICIDPLIALGMDRTRTPIGRYRPWMILGLPFLMLGIHQVLAPGTHASLTWLVGWALVTYLGYSMLTLGQTAWSAALAPTYAERPRLFGWTQGLAVLGSVGLLVLPIVTKHAIVPSTARDLPKLALILMIAFPVAVAICTIFTRERNTAPSPKQKFVAADYRFAAGRLWKIVLADLVLTLGPGTTGPMYVYFFHDAKGFNEADVGYLLIYYIGAGLIGAPIWGRLAAKFGKPRTVQIACVCYGVTQTILMAIPHVPKGYHFSPDGIPTAVGMFSVGFCASAFILLIRSMVADVVDEVRLETKRDLTSLLYSMVTTTTKIGQAITISIVLPTLAFFGYEGQEGAHNTSQAIFVLEMMYVFVPIILVWFGGAMLFGYKLDAARHAEIRRALDEREFAGAEESLIGPIEPESAPAA
jgi:GPH family glycoside/pentoside/hexuronide:cation symporter